MIKDRRVKKGFERCSKREVPLTWILGEGKIEYQSKEKFFLE
jgi:hypothetical protein